MLWLRDPLLFVLVGRPQEGLLDLESSAIEPHEEENIGGLYDEVGWSGWWKEGWNMENEWTRYATFTDMI